MASPAADMVVIYAGVPWIPCRFEVGGPHAFSRRDAGFPVSVLRPCRRRLAADACDFVVGRAGEPMLPQAMSRWRRARRRRHIELYAAVRAFF